MAYTYVCIYARQFPWRILILIKLIDLRSLGYRITSPNLPFFCYCQQHLTSYSLYHFFHPTFTMPSPISVLSLVGTVSALAVKRQDASSSSSSTADYYYFPLDFAYGVDSRFTSNLTFGTYDNARPVKMVMDTGSANTWTWSPNGTVNWGSPYLGAQGPCNTVPPVGYEPALSTTKTLTSRSVGYAYAGNAKLVSGSYVANDTITPEGGHGALPGAQFALVDHALLRMADDGTCQHVPDYDKGIMGLAPSINDSSLAPGPLMRRDAYDSGALQSEVLFMWMDKFEGALGETLTGGMLLSAVDASKYEGELVRVQNKQDAHTVGPYVAKPNVTFAGVTVTPDDDSDCLVDSGAHADSLPIVEGGDVYNALMTQTGGQLVDYNGIFAYNGTCDSIPTTTNITYTFAGQDAAQSVSIDIPLRNFARGYDISGTEGLCLLNLEMGQCILGATFLTGATMALDDADNSVALAQGGVSATGSGVNEASLKVLARGQSYDS